MGGDYWDDEIRNLKDRIEAQDKRIGELEAAINDWHYAIVDWEGCDFVDRMSNPAYRKIIEDVVNAHVALREKKNGEAI